MPTMSTHATPSLGILNLERGLAAGATPLMRPGSLINPATFNFPVILETAEGAWAECVVRGDKDLEPAYVAAAKRLVERGAIAVSSNCGFSLTYQKAVAAA